MARMNYSEDQITLFCEMAQELGISPAMRELGYPKSYSTARYWLDQRGVKITVDSLKSKASKLRHFYGYREQMLSLQTELDRIQEMLENTDLDADSINKLSSALQKTINTMELISGRVTERKESKTIDKSDLELMELINEAKARNANVEEQLLDAPSENDN